MVRWLGVLLMAWAPFAWSEGIVDVLQRSQAQRLQQLSDTRHGEPAAAAVQVIAHSYQTLLTSLAFQSPVSLRVVRDAALAETLQGRVVVVDESLADLPEGERLFVLAHELGHVALAHWTQMGRLYQQLVPGEVMRIQTDAVADLLGREASAQAHRHEFEADAYGLQALHTLGFGSTDVLGLFVRLGARRDTPTHPGTRQRLIQLRSLEAAQTD